eukprot:gnl/TRDRNA2_/TRDRNA2_93582_c0_seq1.p1 gnl/TRDRNA2_/TRDRNA2_93582_c0~~gnl/TRDRNA2_/TRDRNA2_93582_c0_seq1.p1  ORF type:complete len:302 (-),score=29.79 gnl/TRDRNA2_/TRDRNA2_93582_c0_seq1:76-918(-)
MLLAHSGYLVLLTVDVHGVLGAQMLDFGTQSEPIHYMKHQIAYDARLVDATWDTGGNLALVVCWISGGGFEEEPAAFRCGRREVSWLQGTDTLEFSGKLAILAMLGLVFMCCCFRSCSQNNGAYRREAIRLPVFRRRVVASPASTDRNALRAAGRRGMATSISQARLNELRSALSTISATPSEQQQSVTSSCSPVQPTSNSGPPSVECAAVPAPSCDSSVARTRIAGNLCPICQQEVAIRVAMRQCGHTACRDCVLQLVEENKRCHVCNATIEGVLPVYI